MGAEGRSGRRQQFLNDGGPAFDHGQQDLRRAGRMPATLLPVEQRPLGDADAAGERALRQTGAGPDPGDIASIVSDQILTEPHGGGQPYCRNSSMKLVSTV